MTTTNHLHTLLLFNDFLYILSWLLSLHKLRIILNICHANCSQILWSFAISSRFLRALVFLNQMKFVWNFVLVKFFPLSKHYVLDARRKLPFCFDYKKKFLAKIFSWLFSQKYSWHEAKMFYRNWGHTFLLCCVVFLRR